MSNKQCTDPWAPQCNSDNTETQWYDPLRWVTVLRECIFCLLLKSPQ